MLSKAGHLKPVGQREMEEAGRGRGPGAGPGNGHDWPLRGGLRTGRGVPVLLLLVGLLLGGGAGRAAGQGQGWVGEDLPDPNATAASVEDSRVSGPRSRRGPGSGGS